ncbi:MAG: 3-deoxy-7-phosphoheptulonate synthase [Chloroflexota bacterium]
MGSNGTKPYRLVARERRPHPTVVEVKGIRIGGPGVVVIAGPCSVESEAQLLETARGVKAAGAHILRGGAFKPRTSPYDFRGLGKAALELLAEAGKRTGMPVVTEVLSEKDVDLVARYADILQVGCRNMANYALLEAVAETGKPILLKRGMAAKIREWLLAAEYILARGNDRVILCERGIRTFDDEHYRNLLDINAIIVARGESHLPVIADPSHGTGRSRLVTPAALAAIAAGANGLMVEVHPDPPRALSDGFQSLTLAEFSTLMRRLSAVCGALGRPLAQAAPRQP